MARTVLDVDLHENTAGRLLEYEKAQAVIDGFFAALPSVHKDMFDAVIEYMAYLGTMGLN